MLNAVLVLLCLVTGGLSVMEETTRFHQPVHEGAGRLPDEYNAVDGDGMKLYGLIRIPAVKPQNVGHCSWKEVCNLEYSGQFEAAFAKYEELMQKCSDRSWLTLASLGRGETAAVILRRTPCGTLVAAKIPVSPLAAGHNAADCAVLKRLGPFLAAPECQGCFPRYFYYSNVTGICYNQYVPSIPMHRFLRSFNVSLPETIDYVKVAFHQAIDAVAILQANGVTHRDLMFKNMLARPSPGENPPFRLTIMDFCWADSKYDPETYSSTSNFLGHFTRPGDWYVRRAACNC
jgi:hypothetical protein